MSTQAIQTILNRAVNESAFRGLLFSDPNAALAGYELTETEVTALHSLTPENFDVTVRDLESRVSMGVIWGSAP